MDLLAFVLLVGFAYVWVKLDLAINFPLRRQGYHVTYTVQDGQYRIKQ